MRVFAFHHSTWSFIKLLASTRLILVSHLTLLQIWWVAICATLSFHTIISKLAGFLLCISSNKRFNLASSLRITPYILLRRLAEKGSLVLVKLISACLVFLHIFGVIEITLITLPTVPFYEVLAHRFHLMLWLRTLVERLSSTSCTHKTFFFHLFF